MRVLLAAAAAIAVVTGAISAAAQTYPNKSVTIIVPFAAGGPSDALARIMGERMKATLGQSFVVENVTGAAGSIGVGRAVRAAPDGYTISFGHLGTHVANGAIYPLPYDMLTDLEPVVLLPSNPMVVVSRPHAAGEEPQGADRLAQGQPGQGDRGNRRCRLRLAHRGRLSAEPHRAAPAIRALSRHRAGVERSGRRPDRHHRRPGVELDAADPRRRHPRLCDHRHEAARGGARHSDRRGGRPAGIPHDAVERAVGAEGHAEGRRSRGSTRRRWRRWPTRRCRSASTISASKCRRASSRRRRRSRAWHKAEVDKWWPIIKKAGIKPE